MNKDLLLGCFDWYDFDQLKPWVRSAKKHCPSVDIVLIVFNATFDTVDQLVAEGVKVIACEADQNQKMYLHKSTIPVHVERFFHYFNFLKEHGANYRYVLATDVKDVVFQKNPFDEIEWMVEPLKTIIVTGESILYKDEPWGNKNLEQCFGPYFHDYFKNNEIYNVGVIGGDSIAVRDLFLNIFLMSTNRPLPIVDQAVFNVLVYTSYKNQVIKTDMSDHFAVHLGTTMDPKKMEEFLPVLLEKPPVLDRLGQKIWVSAPDYNEFAIVHQWDRVPVLKEYYEKIYA